MVDALSTQELRIVTGFARRSRQIQWLRAQGWIFIVNGVGAPVVEREEYERHSKFAGKPKSKKSGPNLEWFHGTQS